MQYLKAILVILLAKLVLSDSNQSLNPRLLDYLDLKKAQDHGHLFEVLADLHGDGDPEDCTAVTYGEVGMKFSHSFPMIHMTSDHLEMTASLDLGNCFFIFAPAQQNLNLLLANLKESPKFIIRLLLGSDVKAPMASQAESRIPQVYLVKDRPRFIYYSRCRLPRVGMLSHRSGSLIFKTPEKKTHCTFRVGYNPVESMFELSSPSRGNIDTREGFPLQTFIDKEEFQVEFHYADMTWGSYDPETDSWNGLVQLAIEDKIDVGVCYIGYTHQRIQVIDFSNYILYSANYFITKNPGLASPAGNLFRVFDQRAWLSILVSTAILCAMVFLLLRYAYRLDVRFDLFDIIIYFNFISASFPESYIQRAKFAKGSLMLLFGIALMALTVLAKAFGCNLNAILLKPVKMPPMDTACDILNNNKKYLFVHGTFHEKSLTTSGGACHEESAQNFIRVYEHTYEGLLYTVATDPNVVLIDGEEILMPSTLGNPKFEALPKPWFHVSKEKMYSYFVGWILPKKSFIEERINRHVQLCHQAGFELHVERMYHVSEEDSKDQTQPMNFEHFRIGFYILFTGYALAAMVFAKEKLWKAWTYDKNSKNECF